MWKIQIFPHGRNFIHSSKKRTIPDYSAIFAGKLFLMEVTKELVEKLAHLARLNFTEDEKTGIREDLSKMIDFVDKLNEVDTTGVEPLIHMSREVNILREDKVSGSVSRESALKNAPATTGEFFTVPKVIKK
jgi:aspartyl-tRNA(Asn)/glutamyl-tRNA(Gln) amidotransferase subunit C